MDGMATLLHPAHDALAATDVDLAACFGPLSCEREDVPLAVDGALPSWLGGSLYRNGPARFDLAQQQLAHWFDGLGMLHRFAFADGAVRYTNRFVRSEAYHAAARTGKLAYREFASDPCASLFGRVRALFTTGPSDNASVNVAMLGDDVVALTEGALPIAFDRGTLRTIGAVEFHDRRTMRRELTTAHPHSEPGDTPALLNFFTRLGARCSYEVFRLGPRTRVREVVARIPVREPGYMHSFGVTDRWIVLAEFPFLVQPARLALSGKPFIRNFRWLPERGTRFILVDRTGRRAPRVLQGPPCFAFHHVNAYDEGDDVVVDLVAYDDPSIIDALYLDRLRRGAPDFPAGTWRRFRLRDVTAARGATVHEERRIDVAVELPRLDYERVNARPYRWCYATAAPRAGDFLTAIAKLDTEDGSAALWHEPGCCAGEPVFVAAPDATAEDDGVLLSVVLDSIAGRSFLLVLDARDLRELARAEAPHAIPAGFHGAHLG
jgi:carotenoid cleavage dioxygenase-like enzyme